MVKKIKLSRDWKGEAEVQSASLRFGYYVKNGTITVKEIGRTFDNWIGQFSHIISVDSVDF